MTSTLAGPSGAGGRRGGGGAAQALGKPEGAAIYYNIFLVTP
jgi:hypothetical protein